MNPKPLLLGFFYCFALTVGFAQRLTESYARAGLLVTHAANILYVDQHVNGGNGSGDSWENAIPQLADALKWAKEHESEWTAEAPLQIWVASGVYKPMYSPANDNFGNPAGRDNAFLLVSHTQLYGGFSGVEGALGERDWTANQTILSGDFDDDDLVDGGGETLVISNIEDNSYHVLVASAIDVAARSSTILDGFTISGGNANGVSDITVNGHTAWQGEGGGLYCLAASPTVTNVLFYANAAIWDGGGMVNRSASSPRVNNAAFSSNWAYGTSGLGGAIYLNASSPILSDLVIRENAASATGGGIHAASNTRIELDRITLTGNHARRDGGGLWNDGAGVNIGLNNMTIIGNTAGEYGGGLDNKGGTVRITNSLIKGNRADKGGGLMCDGSSITTLINVLVTENTANEGGGVFNYNAGPNLYNTTVWGNTAAQGAAIASHNQYSGPPTIRNSVIFGSIYNEIGAAYTLQYSLLEGNADVSNGNLDATDITEDDVFIDAAGGDLTLKPGSPAINTGNNSFVNVNADLSGNPRIRAAAVDMGAYEYQAGDAVTLVRPTDNTLYVKKGGIGDGSSWANAIPELADALNWAREQYNADNAVFDAVPLKIYVAKGTYKPRYHAADGQYTSDGGRDNSFVLVKNVQLYGGFDPDNGITELSHNRILPEGVEGSAVDGTVLSGDLGTQDDNSDNARHVVISAGNVGDALLDGFAIADGHANGGANITVNGQTIPQNLGGGIFNKNSSPTLTNISIHGNMASNGGGMYNIDSSSPILVNAIIRENTASGSGSGVFNNTGSSPKLTNVIIVGNECYVSGGGMMNTTSSMPMLTNVIITQNRSAAEGGGMMSIFASSPNLVNVTISGNAAINGGGMSNSIDSYPMLVNSIVWGNGASNIYNNLGNIHASSSHNLIDGPNAVGNIADVPPDLIAEDIFVDPDNHDYHLKTGSPAVNVGDPRTNEPGYGIQSGETDLAGAVRVVGGRIDLGAFERQTLQQQVDITDLADGEIRKVYGDEDFVPDATATSGTAVTFSLPPDNGVAAMVDGKIRIVGAGEVELTVNAEGDALYDPVSISVALGVGKKALTIRADDKEKRYGEEVPVLTFSYEGLVNGDTELAVEPTIGTTATISAPVGTYPITLTGGSDPNYDITLEAGMLEVKPWEPIIFYVKQGGAGDGSSWENASGDLQGVLDATMEGDEIWVAAGQYLPELWGSFTMKEGVELYGGFPVPGADNPAPAMEDRDWAAYETVLRGNGNSVVSNAGISLASVLDGFTLTGGVALRGGGMLNIVGASPTLRNLVIYGNHANISGGGMANANSSNPALVNVVIRDNTAVDFGGGMYNEIGASPTLTDVTISDNTASRGGGIYNINNAHPTLTNVVISGNIGSEGGGMYNANNARPTLTNVVISGNAVGTTGGAVFNSASHPTLTNVVISGNRSVGVGAGMTNMDASPILTNTIIWNNHTGTPPSPPNASIANFGTSAPVISNSLIANSGGSSAWNPAIGTDGGNNRAADPLFAGAIDPASAPTTAGDYRLRAGSPAVNAGDPQTNAPGYGVQSGENDVAGNVRIVGGIIDLGAYESPYEDAVSARSVDDGFAVNHGTALGDITAPDDFSVEVTLSDGQLVSVGIDPVTATWLLTTAPPAAAGNYNGGIAGDYVFNVPLASPASDGDTWFTNTSGLTVSVTVTVNKGTPLITWLDPDPITYGTVLGEDQLNATASVPGTFSYSFGSGHLLDAGTHTLAVNFVPDDMDNYETVTKNVQLTVNKAAATLTLSDLNHTYDGTARPATVTTSPAGLTGVSVTYDGSAVPPTEAGSYAVVATLTHANYEATEATGTLVIGKATATLTLSDLTHTYDGTARPATVATSPAGLTGVSVTYDGSAVPPAEAGEYEVVATVTHANYEADAATGTLVIGKAAATLTLSDLNHTYDGTGKAATVATSPAGLTGVSVTYDGSAVPPTEAGNYAVVATLTHANYEATEATGTLVIAKAAATLTLSDLNHTYDGTGKAATVATSPAGLTGVSVTYVGSAVPPTEAGNYAVVAILTHDNYEADAATGTLVIAKAAATLTLSDLNHTYDGTGKPATVTTSPAGLTGVSVTYDGSAVPPAEAGEYEVVATLTHANYEATEATGTLVIGKATATLTLSDLNHTYDGTARPATVTTSPAGLTGVSVTYDGSAVPPTEAGSYAVVATLTHANYEATEATGTLVINKATATLTLSDLNHTYDGTARPATVATSPAGLTGVSVTYDGLAVPPAEAGEYEVVATLTHANYEATEATGTLVIAKAAATLTLSDLNHTYDGTARQATVTTSPAGLTGVSVTYDGSAVPPSEAGEYEVVATLTHANYEADAATGTLVIGKATLAGIAFDNNRFTYDGTAKSLEINGSLPRSVVVSYNGNGRIEAGTYTVTAVIDGGNNYEDLVLRATLEITAMPTLSIAFPNRRLVYDGTQKLLAVTGELPEGVTVTYTNNGRTDVGIQTVTAVIDGGNTYQDMELTATLEIIPASRALYFPALPEKTYGDADFSAGATASTGESVTYVSSDESVAIIVDGLIRMIGAGSATITATVPENGNYDNRPQINQLLTVLRAPQSITFAEVGEVSRDAGSIQLVVSATSGLPVSLAIDDEQVATLSGNTLTIHRLGTIRITATQAGDANHETAAPVTITVRVVDPASSSPVRVHPAVSPNGDGVNESLTIEGIRDYPENRVTLFNRNGTIVWEASGYDNERIAFRGIGTGQLRVPAGTYFYMVEVKVGDTWKYDKGWFVLKY
ncbi:MBG domain-containing protein [Parapedobacter koreensis]|uniref:Gliding motility-associated C-terminal domain-containing protein n=1 Tax=Parapedobacter koreensis TaxID=332977 RepID=A0A1H7TKY1_9SPHI|nr:MBG domain-containing protein [Parapedobacter koreensis]SEL85225.1 gliding motility-associated C-terminal domain-containing protein [Parapedobacter koreensis]